MAEYHPWFVTYYEGSRELWQDEHEPPPLKVGDGLILPVDGYRRFRVTDVWHSYDRHGHFDVGTHVFVEDVTDTEDDYPKRMAPHYFD